LFRRDKKRVTKNPEKDIDLGLRYIIREEMT
jgi:hypothetical protein